MAAIRWIVSISSWRVAVRAGAGGGSSVVVESTPQPELAHRQNKAAVNRGNTLPLTRAPRRLPVQGQLYQPPLRFPCASRPGNPIVGGRFGWSALAACLTGRLEGHVAHALEDSAIVLPEAVRACSLDGTCSTDRTPLPDVRPGASACPTGAATCSEAFARSGDQQ